LAPAPDSPIAVAGAPGSVALDEVNGDARLDLVVARGISVLLGQGDGRFRVSPGSPIKVPHLSTEMVLRDLTGAGKPDLALANHDSYGVMLLFGDGNGGFALAPHSPVIMKEGQHPHTHGLHAGDLNGDGRLDLVTVNSDDNDVSVAFGDGTGGFTRAASSFAVGLSPYPGALGDLNGDGHLDVRGRGCGSSGGMVFGVPRLERALRSADDALTLVAQATISPFAEGKMREMNVHALPWPKEAPGRPWRDSRHSPGHVVLLHRAEPGPPRLEAAPPLYLPRTALRGEDRNREPQ
jgi:hypothetical protein